MSSFSTVFTTPATASAPYSAEAPSSRTSIRLTPLVGMALALTVTTGTRFSACVPGWLTIRRPLSSTSVFPVPSARRLIDAVSPRAALTPPTLLTPLALLNPTSPSWGIERNSSSPELAPIASSSSSPMTVTGKASVGRAPTICEPTITTLSLPSESPAGGCTWAQPTPATASAVDVIRMQRAASPPGAKRMPIPCLRPAQRCSKAWRDISLAAMTVNPVPAQRFLMPDARRGWRTIGRASQHSAPLHGKLKRGFVCLSPAR